MNRRSFFRLAAAPMAAAVIPVRPFDTPKPAAFDRLVRGIDFGPRESYATFLLYDGSGRVVDAIDAPVSVRQRDGGAELLAHEVVFRTVPPGAQAEAWGIRLPAWNIDYVRPIGCAPVETNGGSITLQFRDRVALRLQ